jgi:hypothetical protein
MTRRFSSSFQLAKHASKARKRLRFEALIGEAKYAVRAERPQDPLAVAVRERLRKVNAFDGRP